MNQHSDERPTITIDLSPKLQDYLTFLFGTDETGAIKLNQRDDVGKYISSMWSVSDLPVKQTFENPCRIALPITPDFHYIVKFNFLYVSAWKQQQISLYLESSFSLAVREWFVTGYEKGFKQQKIIEAILDNFNMKNNVNTFDGIKKMDYRTRRKSIKKVVEAIQAELNFSSSIR